MPIAFTCPCGRGIRARDELAGMRIKCPGCREPVTVPRRDADAEEDGIRLLPLDDPPPPARKPGPAEEPTLEVVPVDDEEEESDGRSVRERVRRRERRSRERAAERRDQERQDRARQPIEYRRRRQSGVVFSEGWFGGTNSGIIGGLLMILIALVWFGLGLAAGRIFFYPPVLGVIGVIAIIKGCVDR